MIRRDNSRTGFRTDVGTWEELAVGGGAVRIGVFELPVEGGGDNGAVSGRNCTGWQSGGMSQPCGTDAMAAPQWDACGEPHGSHTGLKA